MGDDHKSGTFQLNKLDGSVYIFRIEEFRGS
jgi:hypothetical protein